MSMLRLLQPPRPVLLAAALAALVAFACTRTGRHVETAGRLAEAAEPAAAEPASPEPAPIDFATDVRPILEAGCTPCHFEGGRMYERLPFDQPRTIRLLGDKLFSRIKEPEQVATIQEFLDSSPAP